MVKVGLVTRSAIPSPRAKPRTKAVLPAPRSPVKATTVPAFSRAPMDAPSASVSSGLLVVYSIGSPPTIRTT